MKVGWQHIINPDSDHEMVLKLIQEIQRNYVLVKLLLYNIKRSQVEPQSLTNHPTRV